MAAEFVSRIWSQFWSPHIWLPPNLTWEHLKSNGNARHAEFSDVLYPIPLSLVFIFVRHIVERYVYFPIGNSYGLRHNRTGKLSSTNPILENAYQGARQRKLTHKEIQGLAKQLDFTERKVERWMRIRRSIDRPSKLTKFSECGWRFLYYLSAFSYGLWVLWDKPHFADISYCWKDYPYHEVTSDTWWYYTLSQSAYWAFLISHFKDVKRKDFWEMLIHHMATLFLLVFSWTLNFHRTGTLVLVVHDCADIFLEGAKMTRYIHWRRTCDILFAIFTITWIVTRLVIFPFWIVWNTTFEARHYFTLFPAYHFMNCLLLVLLGLHIIWTYFIFKVLYAAIAAGQAEKDSRSSSSEELSDEASKSENSSAAVARTSRGKLNQNHSK